MGDDKTPSTGTTAATDRRRQVVEHQNYPAKSLCYGNGDPHYHTHDGAVIDYQGVGWFIMSSIGQLDECQHLKGFELWVEQEKRPPWKNVAFIRAIVLTLTSSGTRVKIEKYGAISVNGAAYQPPVSAPGLVSIDPLTGIIVTSIGIVVQYDGFSTARIWIPLAYRGCVSGLCGNADNVKKNDYRTKGGKNVAARPPNERFWLIGNSYRVGGPRANEQTKDAVNLECKESMRPTFDHTSYCGTLKMKQGPFADCIYNMVRDIKDVHYGHVCPGDLKMSRCARDCESRRTCSNRIVRCSFRCLKKCACPRRTPYRQGDQCLSFRTCKARHLLGRR
ncbi:hypothetical protein NP493_64g05023 [Ridgeia piscesae]|uniref:VWFD domain-containing protein n=1 Tax=Ridgeia piscesae TaxID=27915 RepID=A0AAD9UIQ1_RIDPI|nr:hypothetical protein NP493_64g05023 [Ridgeia piscesae]